MNLQKAPFDAIKGGRKRIELRLLDEKRRQISPLDEIEFRCADYPDETLLCRVTALHPFPTFEALYAAIPLSWLGYGEEEEKSASPRDMARYYSEEEERLYGVVGIELALFDRNGTDYTALGEQLRALVEGVPHRIANLANAAALLYGALHSINWLGFYLLDDDKLVLGPFHGKPACIEIPVGRGVCGTAVARNATVVVSDVHAFPGHIACDSASRSEIVIPLRVDGRIIGVLDIDSPIPARFSRADEEGLSHLAAILSRAL